MKINKACFDSAFYCPSSQTRWVQSLCWTCTLSSGPVLQNDFILLSYFSL